MSPLDSLLCCPGRRRIISHIAIDNALSDRAPMVKKDSESDGYYEGVKKFDWSFADFDARMNDLDMEIESRFGPIGLGLWLGSGVKKIR